VSSSVTFIERIDERKALRAFLDDIDVLVMPSRSEGQGRVLIEAMARGCPCVGTAVGGIPELLDSSMLVPVGDVKALSDLIVRLIANPALMQEAARANRELAEEFRYQVLQPRFEQWLSRSLKRDLPPRTATAST
jgi:glycosyltransferase involved in cell wall biosynthesis